MGRFSKELYDRNVVIKAAYLFTDKYYIHIDTDPEAFIVSFISKESDKAGDVERQYENELIAEQTRVLINEKTGNLRELIAARALSSTIIDAHLENDTSDEGGNGQVFAASDILQDWFSDNE